MLGRWINMSSSSLPLYYKPDKNVYKYLDRVSYEQTYPNQNFVLSMMHPETPYRGMLLTFQLGNGKTYAAAALAHLYNKYGFGVVFLAHNISTIENFRNEYESFVRDNGVDDKKKDIQLMGITKFLLSDVDLKHKLVIIDEAHNLRENANRYKKLHIILEKEKTLKILIITATPMIDKIYEISSLRNLIEPNAPIAYSQTTFNVTTTFVGAKSKIGTLYHSVMKGIQLERYTQLLENSHKDIFTKIRQASLTAGEYDPSIPLDEQSSKVAALLDSLVPHELTVVFSFFVRRGVNFIRAVLLHKGWREWKKDTKSDDDIRPCFAILDGKTSVDSSSSIIEDFNSLQNMSGSVIQMVIGSSVMNESISLRNVKHVHVLTPFWNYGQIRQAIGRTVRLRSHIQDTLVKIYLHVSVVDAGNGEYTSVDMDMYSIAWDKELDIRAEIDFMIEESVWTENCINQPHLSLPIPDNRFVYSIHDNIWDFSQCFDTNPNKISWYNVYKDRAICYSNDGTSKIRNIPDEIDIPTLRKNDITIWVSIIDNKLRLSDLRQTTASKKKMKRGKLVANLNYNEISSIAQYLKVNPDTESIITAIKSKGNYIDKQIKLKDS